jgi:hypothetical protein
VDGEGSFTAYVKNPMQSIVRVRRVQVEPKFYVKLIEKDVKILYALKEFFGCGNVYFQRDNRANHQHCYRFEVANSNELSSIIIPFFKKNSLRFPSKQHDFKLFCEIVERFKRKEHLTEGGLNEIYKLKLQMH